MESRVGFEDTPATIERRLVEGYRRMSPTERIGRVASLNRAVMELARARLRKQYGDSLTERELRLRVAALHLPRETMIRVFEWDPRERGY